MSWDALNAEDVVSTDSPLPYFNAKTGEVADFLNRLEQSLGGGKGLTSGIPCKVLKPGGQWVHGRVRVAIEFEPDHG